MAIKSLKSTIIIIYKQDVDYDEYDDDLDDEDAMADDKHANNGLTHKVRMTFVPKT